MFSFRFSLIILTGLLLSLACNFVFAWKSDDTEKILYVDSDTTSVNNLLCYSHKYKFKDSQKSLDFATRALELSKKIKFTKGTANSYTAIAEVSLVKAHYEKALENYLAALSFFTQANDFEGIANTSNNLGNVYKHTGDYKQAIYFYDKAFQLNKQLHNVKAIADNYSNIGYIYILQDSVDKGLSHLIVALMIVDSIGNLQEKIHLLNGIGNGYLKLKNYPYALKNFRQASEFSEKLGNNYSLAQSYINIANVYYLTKYYTPALKNALNGREIALKENYLSLLQNVNLVLSQIYAAVGNYETAYKYHIQYKSVSDSVSNNEKAKQLAEVMAKYDLENMEKENQLLRLKDKENKAKIQKNNIIVLVSVGLTIIFILLIGLLLFVNRRVKALNRKLTTQGEELKTLNNQKDKFFSFVVHNLSNPFNTIFGFSELLIKYADQKDINKLVRYSRYIFESSTGIKQILSNLLEWTRLQKKNYEYNPSGIELESLIHDTLELNSKIAVQNEITLKYESSGINYAFADRQMVYTILQNLISNAIKFTPKHGRVTVSVSYTGRFVEISVADTGPGLSDDDISRLFKINVLPSSVNTMSSKGSGMGLILCKELVNRNGGEIKVESITGKGSTFKFTLPIPESEIEHIDVRDKSIEAFITALRKRFEKEKNLPEEFVTEMKKLLPMHERLGKALSVRELKEFSMTVIRLSEKYHVRTFKIYGQKLFKYVDELQFDKILKIFPEFTVLVNESHS